MAYNNRSGSGRSSNRPGNQNRQKRPGEKFDIARGMTEIRGDYFVTVFTVGINNQDHVPVQGRIFVVTCIENANSRVSDAGGDEFVTFTTAEVLDRPELVGKYIWEIARPIADVEGRTETYRFSIPGNGNELDVKIQKVKYEVRKPRKFEVDILDLGISQTATGDYEAAIRVTVYDNGALYEGEDVTLSRGGVVVETKTTDVDGRADFTVALPNALAGKTVELHLNIEGQRTVRHKVSLPDRPEATEKKSISLYGKVLRAINGFEVEVKALVYCTKGLPAKNIRLTCENEYFSLSCDRSTGPNGQASFLFNVSNAEDAENQTFTFRVRIEGEEKTEEIKVAIPMFEEETPPANPWGKILLQLGKAKNKAKERLLETAWRTGAVLELGRAKNRLKERLLAMIWHSALTLVIAVAIWVFSGNIGNQIIALMTGLFLLLRGRTKFWAFVALAMFVFSYMAPDFFTFPIWWAAWVLIFAELFYWLEEIWRKPALDQKGQAQDAPFVNFYPWWASAACVIGIGFCFVGLMKVFIPDLSTPPIGQDILTATELPMPKDALITELPMPGTEKKLGIPAWLRQQIIDIIQWVTPTWLTEGYLKAQDRLNWLIAWLMSFLLLKARALPGEARDKMKGWWKGGTGEGAGKTIGAAFIAEWFTGLFRRKKK